MKVSVLHYYAVLFVLVLLGCSGQEGEKIASSGTIEATQITVSAKVAGEILKLFAGEGESVNKGDTLALINHDAADIELKQAEANVRLAEAQYRLVVKGARQEDILLAEANFRNAKDDYLRVEELFKGKSATQKQFDDAKTRLIVAEQTYEKLKHGTRSEEIDAALARREQAQAVVEAINKKINDATVLSPSEGIITQKIMEEGEIVVPGGMLFRVSQLAHVYVVIYVTEVELAKVKLSQQATVTIDALPEKPFTGTVIHISQQAEFTPKNIQTKNDRTKLVFGVKIEIPNPNLTLKPGMPADAILQ